MPSEQNQVYMVRFQNYFKSASVVRKYTRKNAQVVTDLQTSWKQGCCEADIRMCSHCLFPVVATSLEQVVITLLQG